jgi:hypothetical protein
MAAFCQRQLLGQRTKTVQNMANEEKVIFRRLTVLIKNLENDATQGSLFWHACKLPPVYMNSQNWIRLHKIGQKDRNFPIFFGRTTKIRPILAVRVNEGLVVCFIV